MIEVLTTIVVVSFALLGLARLQVLALSSNKESSNRSVATMLAYQAIDSMRANRDIALAGTYSIALAANAPTGAAIADNDLRIWKQELARRLPGGDGSIAVAAGAVRVTVQWDGSKGDGSAPKQFVMESRL